VIQQGARLTVAVRIQAKLNATRRDEINVLVRRGSGNGRRVTERFSRALTAVLNLLDRLRSEKHRIRARRPNMNTRMLMRSRNGYSANSEQRNKNETQHTPLHEYFNCQVN
jgi:hypothetical protein